MTKFHSRLVVAALASLALAGCATSSGLPAARIAEPDIAAAYIPLRKTFELGLQSIEGAAVVIAPGIAATCAHNANLLDPKMVIGSVSDYDLLFFRTDLKTAPPTAEPQPGESVTAYGEGIGARLRVAHGVVRTLVSACTGCSPSAYFTFSNEKPGEGDAGPGFSGGPVIDSASGRLVGITFGYMDAKAGHGRLIYAYSMARVRAELALVERALPRDMD